MSSQKQQHFARKQKVMDLLKRSENFLIEDGKAEDAKSIAAQYNNVVNGEFSISVVGEFSSGKSTFLNALMGEMMLPSFSRETTATVNFLRHKKYAKKNEEGTVYYIDGNQKPLPKADFNTIKKYVSTESTENVAKTISHLDLYLDNRFLQDNVTLVDTPGLNGLKEGHRELTEHQMEASSAGIFLFNATQPGSLSQFEALHDLHSKVNSILLVLNQIDEIKTNEGDSVERVVNDLKDKYKNAYKEETTIPEIFPISALKALIARSSQKIEYRGKAEFSAEEKARFEKESGMIEFEDRLWRYLTQGEKGRQMLLSPVEQLISKLLHVRDGYDEELEVLAGKVDTENLKQQCQTLKDAIAALEKEMQKRTRDVRNELNDAEDSFTDEIRAELVRYRDDYMMRIENFTSLDDIDPEHIKNEIERRIKSITETAYNHYGDSIKLLMRLNDLSTSDLGGLLNSIHVKIDKDLEVSSFELGIEAFDREMQQLNQQKKDLISEIDAAGDDVIQQKRLQRENQRIQDRITSMEEGRRWYEQNARAAIPSIRERTDYSTEFRERGGVFGKVADFLVGQKSYEVPNVVRDSTERDEYLRDMKSELDNYDRKIQSLNEEIYATRDADPEGAERKERKLQSQLADLRDTIAKQQEKFAEEVKKRCQAALKKQKDEVEDYLCSAIDGVKDQIYDAFEMERKSKTDAIMTLIAAPVQELIQNRQLELEMLQKTAQANEAEKAKREKELHDKTECLSAFLSEALTLKQELESIQIDVIEEQSL